MIELAPSVFVHPDRQFVTGGAGVATPFLPEDAYASALDALVIVCVDCIPIHDGKVLLSHRTREPHPSWWINGGRMRKGELFGAAASRLMWTELGLRLAPDRFHLMAYYSLLWDTRAQAPWTNGCHTLSVAHTLRLTDAEAAGITPNEEYDATRWVAPEAILDPSAREYHPALTAMVGDLLRLR
jgi:ADP-ribose pyrophosphatase YjhB (NUDIX family)